MATYVSSFSAVLLQRVGRQWAGTATHPRVDVVEHRDPMVAETDRAGAAARGWVRS
jgi:hypothetical protein